MYLEYIMSKFQAIQDSCITNFIMYTHKKTCLKERDTDFSRHVILRGKLYA